MKTNQETSRQFVWDAWGDDAQISIILRCSREEEACCALTQRLSTEIGAIGPLALVSPQPHQILQQVSESVVMPGSGGKIRQDSRRQDHKRNTPRMTLLSYLCDPSIHPSIHPSTQTDTIPNHTYHPHKQQPPHNSQQHQSTSIRIPYLSRDGCHIAVILRQVIGLARRGCLSFQLQEGEVPEDGRLVGQQVQRQVRFSDLLRGQWRGFGADVGAFFRLPVGSARGHEQDHGLRGNRRGNRRGRRISMAAQPYHMHSTGEKERGVWHIQQQQDTHDETHSPFCLIEMMFWWKIQQAQGCGHSSKTDQKKNESTRAIN